MMLLLPCLSFLPRSPCLFNVENGSRELHFRGSRQWAFAVVQNGANNNILSKGKRTWARPILTDWMSLWMQTSKGTQLN